MGDPVVELTNGSVRGSIETHEEGFNYYAFKGIPFAEPPIGELRFKDPVPKKSWKEVLDCKKYAPMILQYDYFSGTRSINEDGLHLNVFTRTINNSNANKPVMMVVHGGAYVSFSGDDFYNGAEHLIRKDLVIVTINYRIGVLGFLNLEDDIAPGNQGLKDMVLALHWIQKNIKIFGGNPNNVTIYGPSGGGSAAHFLAISPLAKGLIHKVISQTCVAFNAWAMVRNPKSYAIKLCSLLGRELTDSQAIVDFLRTVDAKPLQEAQEKLIFSKDTDAFPFGPGNDSRRANPFFPVDPWDAASEGVHLPYLVGYSAREGLILLKDGFIFKGESREDVMQRYDQNHELFFRYNGDELLTRYKLSATQVKRLYYKSETVACKNLDKLADLMSDLHFIESIHRFARVQADRSSAATYMYVFDFNDPDLLSKKFLKDVPDGVSHMDDAPYLLKMRLFQHLGIEHFKKGTKNYRVMDQMTEMWANFAKSGRPTTCTTDLIPVHWLPIHDGTLLRYLSVDEDLLMKTMVNLDQKFLSAKNIRV